MQVNASMAELSGETFQKIETEKTELRKRCLAIRQSLQESRRIEMDQGIAQNLILSPEFIACELLLSYVSTAFETDTRWVIDYALKTGKTVAVPRCVKGKNEIEFYRIESLDSLKKGSYGLLEPEPDSCHLQSKTAGGLCLLPGLAFDLYGNRLGYGGGYYDRFLEGFHGVTAGLCRSPLLFKEKLACGPNDRAVMLVVTEKGLIRPNETIF
jgi:5-formyltetrahydrofolate cyclo-ligase